MSRPVNPNVPEDGFKSKKDFNDTGAINYQDLTITSGVPYNKQIVFDPTGQSAGKSVTIAAGANSSNITITLPTTSGQLVVGGGTIKVAYIQDQKASGTNGGVSTAGSWQTRNLNALDDHGTGITIASNQMIIPAGTYHIKAKAPFHGVVNRANIRLQNITDSTTVLSGTSTAETSASVTFWSFIEGSFTIASQKTMEIQYQVQTAAGATQDLGFSSGGIFTVATEIYTQVEIRQE